MKVLAEGQNWPRLSRGWQEAGWITGAWKEAKGKKVGVETHVQNYSFDFSMSAVVNLVPADMENYPKDPRTKWKFLIPRINTSSLDSNFDTANEAMEACSAILAELAEGLCKDLRTPSELLGRLKPIHRRYE